MEFSCKAEGIAFKDWVAERAEKRKGEKLAAANFWHRQHIQQYMAIARYPAAFRSDMSIKEAARIWEVGATKVALGKALEKIVREAAKERQREHGGTAPGKKNTCGNFPQPVDKGRTRDKVGKAVGMSGRTYQRAKAVVDAAEATSIRGSHTLIPPCPTWASAR